MLPISKAHVIDRIQKQITDRIQKLDLLILMQHETKIELNALEDYLEKIKNEYKNYSDSVKNV